MLMASVTLSTLWLLLQSQSRTSFSFPNNLQCSSNLSGTLNYSFQCLSVVHLHMYKDQNPCPTYRCSSNNRSQQWILAEYLGEDQIVAVLCRSFGAACALEL
ncbi:hypothetical protein ACOSQ4_013645 [Xanthoceras sorbifolium]